MYYPSLKEFLELSKKGNVIPVYKEINADLDTPVSAYLKLKKGEYSFLLESVEGQEKIARYSFLGTDPLMVFKSKDRDIEVIYPQDDRVRRFKTSTDPLDEIKKMMSPFKPVVVKGLPRFYGGLVGYIGYGMVRFFEDIPKNNPDDLKLPSANFILADTILVFDHVNHTIKIVSNVLLHRVKGASAKKKAYARAVSKIERIHGELNVEHRVPLEKHPAGKIKISSNFEKSGFSAMIRRGKAHIKKGDIIQVVLSQRFKLQIKKRPLDIYRSLRSLNPSPYMFFLKLKDIILVGASPEMHVRCEKGIVEIRPIAGTRPRGRTEELDKKLEQELLDDVKEKAEHLMLVDLARNDLGRVCRIGRVRVREFMTVARYSHVMHLVSEVEGELDKKYDIYDILRATFPAGTVSGSPKVRAMEIIDDLENTERGPYAGCLGYLGFSGNMDTCIIIRTIVIKDNAAYIQAGAGIVADSRPEKEYQESVNKAKALIEAITK
ncbi:MAG: anthranilate synthase component I [Candidatus Omnitrophica bacterium]|nr:anthranilate synthase component I [Candidatus Omnitrophota bacterium]